MPRKKKISTKEQFRNYGDVRKIGRSIARYKIKREGINGMNDTVNGTWSKREMQRIHKSGRIPKALNHHRSYFADTWREWVSAE